MPSTGEVRPIAQVPHTKNQIFQYFFNCLAKNELRESGIENRGLFSTKCACSPDYGRRVFFKPQLGGSFYDYRTTSPEPRTTHKHRVSRIEYPASSIQHRVSSIENPASRIQYRLSAIASAKAGESSIEYPVSSIQYRVSSIQNRVSSIEYRATNNDLIMQNKPNQSQSNPNKPNFKPVPRSSSAILHFDFCSLIFFSCLGAFLRLLFSSAFWLLPPVFFPSCSFVAYFSF